jgi:hypothetical protein
MRLLTIAASLLLTAAPALAQVDPKIAKQCQPAADFAGCVKSFTTPAAATDELLPLRNAMKQVAERLTLGTSLVNSSATYQPVVDQLALVESKYSDDPTVNAARRATDMFGTAQSAWDIRIKAAINRRSFPSNAYHCNILKSTADAFDTQYSTLINWKYGTTTMGRLFGLNICTVPTGSLPEDYMLLKVVQTLKDGSVDPTARAGYPAKLVKALSDKDYSYADYLNQK